MHSYEKTLLDLSNVNENLIVCTAETRFAMRNLPDLLGDKFFDVGISEQTLIGSVAGLSKMGMIPVAHALASFLLFRPYEFIRTDLGLPCLPSILVGSFNGFISQANGPTHQAIDDISLMGQVPNMRIVVPSNLNQTCELLRLSVENVDSPIYFRFNDIKSSNNDNKITWEKNIIAKEGKNSLVISYGLCYNILEKVFKNNFKDLGLANFLFVKPLIKNQLDDIFSKYNQIIVVEDHKYQGGLCHELKSMAFDFNYKGKISGINLENRFFKPALLEDVLSFEGFSEQMLIKRIKEII